MERNQSIKADGDKLRLELIPPETYTALGEVLTFGAKKYSANSWQGVEPERYIGALLRHLVEYMKDPKSVDSDSGLTHAKHMLCNAMFLQYFSEREK